MNFDYPAKAAARKAIHKTLNEHSLVPIRKRRIVILDTAQALETQHLVKMGYTPSNIHMVNWSHGELAWATRTLKKLGITDVQHYEGDLLTCCALVNPDAINYDGCGPMGCKVKSKFDGDEYLRALLRTLSPKGVFNYTILMGRDQNPTIRMLLKSMDSYTARMAYLLGVLHTAPDTKLLNTLTYPSQMGLEYLCTQVQLR